MHCTRLAPSDGAGVAIYDMTDLTAPRRIHAWANGFATISGIALRGDTLFLAAGWDGLVTVALPR